MRTVSQYVLDAVSREMERRSGLSLDWYELLLRVWHNPEGRIAQHELDGYLRLSQSGISRILSKMEQAGLIRREVAHHDRRNIMVSISPAGADLVFRAAPVYNRAVQHHFGKYLSEGEAVVIRNGLGKIASAEMATSDRRTPSLNHLVSLGKSVLSLTSDSVEVSDAILVRDALEAVIVTDASRTINASGVAQLREAVTRMSTLIDKPTEFFHADWALHRAIAGHVTNALLRSTYLNLLDIISSHTDTVIPTANLRQYLLERLAVHARLVDAIASGDEGAVDAAVKAHHFTSTRTNLVDARKAAAGHGEAGADVPS